MAMTTASNGLRMSVQVSHSFKVHTFSLTWFSTRTWITWRPMYFVSEGDGWVFQMHMNQSLTYIRVHLSSTFTGPCCSLIYAWPFCLSNSFRGSRWRFPGRCCAGTCKRLKTWQRWANYIFFRPWINLRNPSPGKAAQCPERKQDGNQKGRTTELFVSGRMLKCFHFQRK